MFWQCNVSLVLAPIGALLGRHDIVGATVACVALDQSLWWVDVGSYILFRKFSVGVAKYMTWPETSWIRVFTSTHHMWFIPFCAYFNDGLPWSSLYLSAIMVAYMAVYSRLTVPFEVSYNGEMKYLNTNCTYECWKDVHIKFLHIADRKFHIDTNFFYSFCMLNAVWTLGNSVCFTLIKLLFPLA